MQKTSSRLLALLSLLQTHRDWSGGDLAGRLAVTSRTVRRDIDRLRELGYRISTVKGPGGGYRLEAGAQLPPLLFDDGQAVALAVALQTAAAGTAVAEDAARALATLRQVLPSRLRHRIDLLRVTAVRPPADPVGPEVLVELSRAIHAREELRLDHTPGGLRRVQPHHLVTRGQRWYLVAWDLDRADWRTFRVDRVRPRTPAGPRFTPRELPGGSVAAFVTSRFRGNDGTATAWPCRGEVVLHLPAAEVAPFAEDAIVEELGPRRCRLTAGSWSWTGLAAAVGRFDAEIEVVGPPELAAAFAGLAARYARAAAPPEAGPAT
ncbi:WYL domain-containing transcriptional regulator [Streptomyces sp. V2]|uniref:helix-turn-helix transcriptional regulator n=1 Tax=Streptomyces TaxID=1883 RepID=UPI0006EBC8EC|nr:MULTISPECIES: WYL domain-containing protein [Streptomyces]PWG14455.1 WYL domain-containing transcriptional regulator [Streptomyces sp. V2]